MDKESTYLLQLIDCSRTPPCEYEIVMEIPCKPNSFEPDLDKAEDYDLPQQN